MFEMLAVLAVALVMVPAAFWILKLAGYCIDVHVSFTSHPLHCSGPDDDDGDGPPAYSPRFPSAYEDN